MLMIFQLNGELEVGENIADNGGIKLAHKVKDSLLGGYFDHSDMLWHFQAYQVWRGEQTFQEPALPDLTTYTPDQMFFIAYAQVCLAPFFR